MSLRRWQAECLNQVLDKYSSGQSHCLVTATPGAGKTYLSAELTKLLFERHLIEFVICIAPSVDVANSFRVQLEKSTARRMDGRLGSYGETRTYHSLSHLDNEFWKILDSRVLLIFDEIHHCAGVNTALCNSWGLSLLKHVKNRATFTLALTGTPWRTDKLPITLSKYCDQLGIVSSDYSYSLEESIKENVCRTPIISIIDNDKFCCETNEGSFKKYSSISDTLDSGITFQQILENEIISINTIGYAVERLNNIRLTNPEAAGLVVASNINHANRLREVLKKYHNQYSVVVTSDDQNAHRLISDFRDDDTPWIISVSMISEGTNIPRLQVCCYMTNVRTELYFRQVLGRILRTTPNASGYAYLYILAEPSLSKYANRVAKDVPVDNIVVNECISESGCDKSEIFGFLSGDSDSRGKFFIDSDFLISFGKDLKYKSSSVDSPILSKIDGDVNLSVYGKFLEEIIKIDGFLCE